jgi:hypothetical protein
LKLSRKAAMLITGLWDFFCFTLFSNDNISTALSDEYKILDLKDDGILIIPKGQSHLSHWQFI